jgi:serine phosphatase RsbU (regulator of sigma subunit)
MCFPVVTVSQNLTGTPFIKNYSANEYAAATDNWAIAQDKRGIMYFGNALGVLEYDGSKWKLIPVSNHSLVRSIAVDNDGIVYIGAVGEFGFLSPDDKGAMVYHSLSGKLPSDERDFADVWKTYVTPEGIYFQTFTKLIRLKGNELKIWKPETSFHFSFFVNNHLYINERDKGLKKAAGDGLNLVSRGELFSDKRIYSMISLSDEKILVATREAGLYTIEQKTNATEIKHLNSPVNENLTNDQVYGGLRLSNGNCAFATLKKGVIITDVSGNVIQTLSKANGLQDDIVKAVNIDSQNDLWLALGNGISKVEISSPLTFLNESHGLKGSIEDILKNRDVLYVATSLGTYSNSLTKDEFHSVENIDVQTWSLLRFIVKKDTLLFASSDAGIFRIDGNKGLKISDDVAYSLYQSKTEPARIFIGTAEGLSSLRYENKKWIHEGSIKGIEKEIRSINEDESGSLWLGAAVDGVIRIEFRKHESFDDSLLTSWDQSYKIHTYDTTSGLPGMQYNIPYSFMNKIVFATFKGLYEFDKRKARFYPSSLLNEGLQDRQIYRFAPKDSTRIWMFTVTANDTKESGVAYLQKDKTYTWYSKPFGKVRESEIHAIYPDENGITWLGGPDGLLRYDANIRKDFSKTFYCHIRKVAVGKDSVVFGGSFFQMKDSINYTSLSQSSNLIPAINYSYNSLSFEFSTTSFGDEKSNEFNIYLEGFDEGWSGWSTKSLKEYTNLKEGHYIFRLKAKNIYGTESIEAIYEFRILPPWYRTIWAYIGYVIVAALFIYLMVQMSVRRLKKAKVQLEKVVKERTAEVVKQKELVEHQKLLVESKNKDITDSINYAQRIQRSLLASDKLLEKHLNDYFIFFQPKDIVSGDFYWAAELADGNFTFVTADSTGHGVPGAIMSMLNISCLNEAVNGNKLTAPDEILNYTRQRIISHLSNDGSAEGGKDGMDCSIIRFDFIKKEIVVAAANNPVWIVRNKELIEIDADKMPVGKHDNDKTSFSKKPVQVREGDVIYSLTDGMPDQFGGPKGKKFMYRQLKELLISISQESMAKQKEILSSTINTWKGDLEQVDDICLVGVRIH